jgi:hypothetical protein
MPKWLAKSQTVMPISAEPTHNDAARATLAFGMEADLTNMLTRRKFMHSSAAISASAMIGGIPAAIAASATQDG